MKFFLPLLIVIIYFLMFFTNIIPAKKIKAKIIREGFNPKKYSWLKFFNIEEFLNMKTEDLLNMKLIWTVAFQEIKTGKEIELQVFSGYKYDDLKIGQEGTLVYKLGVLKKFIVEEKNENRI